MRTRRCTGRASSHSTEVRCSMRKCVINLRSTNRCTRSLSLAFYEDEAVTDEEIAAMVEGLARYYGEPVRYTMTVESERTVMVSPERTAIRTADY
jgi:hypothetical protein